MTEPCPPATAMAARGEKAGWSVTLLSGESTVRKLIAGTSPREYEDIPVASWGMRAWRPGGREVRAVWLSSSFTKTGKRSWSMAYAVRGRHAGEYIPPELGAKEVGPYLDETREFVMPNDVEADNHHANLMALRTAFPGAIAIRQSIA